MLRAAFSFWQEECLSCHAHFQIMETMGLPAGRVLKDHPCLCSAKLNIEEHCPAFSQLAPVAMGRQAIVVGCVCTSLRKQEHSKLPGILKVVKAWLSMLEVSSSASVQSDRQLFAA